MNILFIAPLSPPITGQSLAAEVLLDELNKLHFVKVINFRKDNFSQGMNSFTRILKILGILLKLSITKNSADVIYLTISQSLAGNIKDLFTYLICFRKLDRMLIHLHGGGIRKLIFNKNKFLFNINNFFLKRVRGSIVLGESLRPIFKGIVPNGKLYVIPNFAEDYLFLTKKEIKEKHKKNRQLNILFLSNLIQGKGHDELVGAYQQLDKSIQRMISIDFAGDFESTEQKNIFLKKIMKYKNIKYHGVVKGDKKRDLFFKAHIFCLPSYYLYEGQPISILEAYASGCVVVTTDHGGIKDVFRHGVNGYEVKKRSIESLEKTLLWIAENTDKLLPIALSNRNIAFKKYRVIHYLSSFHELLKDLAA